jgi:hypothetical protein
MTRDAVVAFAQVANAVMAWDEARGVKDLKLAHLRQATRTWRIVDTPAMRATTQEESERQTLLTGEDVLIIPPELQAVVDAARALVFNDRSEREAFAALAAAVDDSPGDPTPRPFDGH